MSSQLQRQRWFGTPVGAALLLGAVGGGLMTATSAFGSVVHQWIGHRIGGIFLYQAVCTTTYVTVLAAAPAICLKNGRKVFGGLLAGVISGGISFVLSWAWYFSMVSGIKGLGLVLPYLIVLLHAAVLGYATARLYEVREVQWRCLLVTTLSGILTVGIWAAFRFATTNSGVQTEVALTLKMLTAMLLVLPPAIIVERQMKRSEAVTNQQDSPEINATDSP